MRITVRHSLSLELANPPGRAVQHLLLTPRSSATQTVASWSISAPGIERAARFTDAFGNIAHLLNQPPGGEAALAVTVEGEVETHDRNGVLGRPLDEPMAAIFMRQTELTPPEPELCAPFRPGAGGPAGRIAILHGLMDTLAAGTPETPQPEPMRQAQMGADGQVQEQTLGTRAEAPARQNDPTALSHAFIAAARALGIPARYVTGYLLPEEGSASLHAWAEAFDHALGWIGFDSALGMCPTDRHIRLASGLDAAFTMPLRSVPVGVLRTLELRLDAAKA